MKKYIIWCLVFVLVIILVVLNVFKKEDNSNLRKLKLAEVAHTIFYAPQYAAISNGYFEEEGLDICGVIW